MSNYLRVVGIAVVTAAVLVTTGCGSDENSRQDSDLNKIIGTNGLVPVNASASNLPQQLRRYADGIGLISVGCTGTHIGDGLVLTAGHCFTTGQARRQTDIKCGRNPIRVSWGFRRGVRPYLVSRCKRILVLELSANRDYAVFQVDVAPPVAVPVAISNRVRSRQAVTLMTHPSSRALEWSQNCQVAGSARVGGAGTGHFTYNCDTEPGSSGAAVMNASTGEIVGVHNGAGGSAEPFNYATYVTEFLPHRR